MKQGPPNNIVKEKNMNILFSSGNSNIWLSNFKKKYVEIMNFSMVKDIVSDGKTQLIDWEKWHMKQSSNTTDIQRASTDL